MFTRIYLAVAFTVQWRVNRPITVDEFMNLLIVLAIAIGIDLLWDRLK